MLKKGDRVKLNFSKSMSFHKREGVDFYKEYVILYIKENYAFLNEPIGGKYSNAVDMEYLESIKEIRKEKLRKIENK